MRSNTKQALLVTVVGVTLFVALLCAVGVFLGAVKDKASFLKNLINKLFPPKE